MQIATRGPLGNGVKPSTLEVRKSKVEIELKAWRRHQSRPPLGRIAFLVRQPHQSCLD